jgi:hypothetical protein
MRNAVPVSEKRKALEQIVGELDRLQGIARTAGESFIAFLIASAQREAGARCNELTDDHQPTPAE